jgi:hypothetical protein
MIQDRTHTLYATLLYDHRIRSLTYTPPLRLPSSFSLVPTALPANPYAYPPDFPPTSSGADQNRAAGMNGFTQGVAGFRDVGRSACEWSGGVGRCPRRCARRARRLRCALSIFSLEKSTRGTAFVCGVLPGGRIFPFVVYRT